MVAVRNVLRAADAPLSVTEVALAVYGSKNVTRSRGGRRRRVAVPNGDPSNIRRALNALLRGGAIKRVADADVSEAGRHGRQPHYVISDRFTRNESRSGSLELGELAPLSSAALPENDVIPVARRVVTLAGFAQPGNDTRDRHHAVDVPGKVNETETVLNGGDGCADLTTQRVLSGSGEASGSSARLSTAGGVPIRGVLPVSAQVFPWERGLLFTLADDLLRELSHAANEDDDSDS
jgi:hypothetical protein